MWYIRDCSVHSKHAHIRECDLFRELEAVGSGGEKREEEGKDHL